MKIIVHARKGEYRVLFLDGNHVHSIGHVEIASTPKGERPKHYLTHKPGRKQFRNTPTKELIELLRGNLVQLTAPDARFESFLRDLQIPFSYVNVCRICLLEDRFTPLDEKTSYILNREPVCLECARREIRREVGYFGRFGTKSLSYIEHLLEKYRDLDRVLAAIQPEKVDTSRTLYDRLEAHPVIETSRIDTLGLPEQFVRVAGVERLMPVQQLCIEAGLLQGRHLLVVAATASGKTFIGEMAGAKNFLQGRGRMLFLVPLVALANQKYQRFRERYGSLMKVALHVGVSRLNLPETRPVGERDLRAAIVVGTYEGIDHYLRSGNRLKDVGTIVIDEVQMLEDPDRGHRLDGLIARLKYLAPQAQYLYLSATIGVPQTLAKKLGADLITYAERPVPLERHLYFVERAQKIRYIRELVDNEFAKKSSKGFRGQTIIFTNARSRCHLIADAIGRKAMPYHAGLTSQERRDVENKFANGKIAAVVTTAALAAGVDFPASQVVFDALAMGIEWLTVQEFHQMSGRAGRPDFHDLGKVVILAEPGGVYSRETTFTEEEVAVRLLTGEMEEVAPEYDFEQSSEEYVAHAIVARGSERDCGIIQNQMVGRSEPVQEVLRERDLVRLSAGKIEVTELGRVMAEHFIGADTLLELQQLIRTHEDPVRIVAELECAEMEKDR
ncbi:MAG: DEAD/DEAH box helicase [Methanomicrobiales archaeon]|nr:DEAD/DEAH box helicase [Methanomicrobiales archaeon]